MKVHLIKRLTIDDFVKKNSQSELPFINWLTAIKFADWDKPQDILETFGSADLLGNGSSRVVFNIGGNKYRLICQYAFGEKEVHLYVCWIGTHSAYDRLCSKELQYDVSEY